MPKPVPAAAPAPRPPLVLAGLEIQRYGWEEAMDAVLAAAADRPVRIGWIYANCANIARRDPAYREAAGATEFLFNDGAGVELAGRVLGRPVVANLCGTDWIPALLDRIGAAPAGLERIFLLGTTEAVLARSREVFADRWPGLTVAGTHHGFFSDPEPVLAAIAAARPQILLVAMGVPLQERFLAAHWERLAGAGVRLGIAGGAVLDFVTDSVPRAPAWMRRLRLEWFYRLWKEPRRLWRRYLVGNAVFLIDLAAEWWRRRKRPWDHESEGE